MDPRRSADSPHEQILTDLAELVEFVRATPDLKPMCATVEHYARPDVVQGYVDLLTGLVVDRTPSFFRTTGLDFGCWYGLSTLMLWRYGARQLFGVDVNEVLIDRARRCAERLGARGIEFRTVPNGQLGTVPLADGSVDWVLVNDVFSFSHPDAHERMAGDIHRILRSGGTLFFSDGNNPHHPETRRRLLSTYALTEHGDGGAANPDGVYHRLRRDYIARRFPDLAPEQCESLARETAYSWGAEIDAHVAARLREQPAAAQPFDRELMRVPIHPLDGRSCGAVTDPIRLTEMLRTLGFEPELLFRLDPRSPGSIETDLEASGRFYIIGRKP
jgi:SAM-dependent methyltransferase